MEHDIPEAEVHRWHAAILEDEWTPKYALDQLAKHDHAYLIALLHRLLGDDSPDVQRIALQKLWQHGDLDEAVVHASRLPETDNRSLLFEVVAVLRASGSPAAIAALSNLAERGNANAFRALVAVARMPPDKLHAITLACARVFDPVEEWRVAAVGALHGYLERRAWEELAIEVARRYMDEGVFAQLATWATPRVIPALQFLLERIGPVWAESKDIARTIEHIRSRATSVDTPSAPD
jgi:hypothetical protein